MNDVTEDIEKFLLDEYRMAMDFNKYMYEIHYRWVRLYWVMIAAVFVGLYYFQERLRENIETFRAISILLFVLLAIFGFLVFLITLFARVRSVEFFNTANRIRGYFKHKLSNRQWSDAFYLPTTDQRLFRIGGLDFMSTIILILLNSVFISVPFLFSLSPPFKLRFEGSYGTLVFVSSLVVHVLFWFFIFKAEQRRQPH